METTPDSQIINDSTPADADASIESQTNFVPAPPEGYELMYKAAEDEDPLTITKLPELPVILEA